ncbi:MAG TPA: HNH endonuclease signature motif containing protein [Thermoanaerobaculia bacterium]|nr:HNH endonuclease signature motif containing protein [Thermoanaerobaculia bacterium]
MRRSNETREFVRRRAHDACEYCGLPQHASVLPHQIDHIVGRQHRGTDDLENLCLCCIRCNLKKGPNIASIDPMTRLVSALYHPRYHVWSEHFAVVEAMIIGLTAEGRTTVELMDMNNEERVRLRSALLRRGWHP